MSSSFVAANSRYSHRPVAPSGLDQGRSVSLHQRHSGYEWQVRATFPEKTRSIAVASRQELKVGRRYEWILVGTNGRNARWVKFSRPVFESGPSESLRVDPSAHRGRETDAQVQDPGARGRDRRARGECLRGTSHGSLGQGQYRGRQRPTRSQARLLYRQLQDQAQRRTAGRPSDSSTWATRCYGRMWPTARRGVAAPRWRSMPSPWLMAVTSPSW